MCDKSTRKYTLWQVYIWLKLEWSKTWSKTCPKKEKICFCLTRSITHFFNVKKFYILHSLKSKICTKTKYKSFHMKSFLITHYFLLFIEFDKVASAIHANHKRRKKSKVNEQVDLKQLLFLAGLPLRTLWEFTPVH